MNCQLKISLSTKSLVHFLDEHAIHSLQMLRDYSEAENIREESEWIPVAEGEGEQVPHEGDSELYDEPLSYNSRPPASSHTPNVYGSRSGAH